MAMLARTLAALVFAVLAPVTFSQGTQSELRDLLADQYTHADALFAAASATQHAARALDALATLARSGFPVADHPRFAEALVAMASPGLASLTKAQHAHAQALLASELRVDALLRLEAPAGSEQAPSQHVVGVTGGALVILGLFGSAAGIALAATEPYDACEAQVDAALEPGENRSARMVECIVRAMPGTAASSVVRFVVAVGEEVAIALLPSGKVKTVVKVIDSVQDVENIRAFGSRGCDGGTDGSLLPDRSRRALVRIALPEALPSDLYVGRPDAAGVLHGVPAGDWTFVFFAPDHARSVSGCVVVRPGGTSDLDVEMARISDVAIPGGAGDARALSDFVIVSEEHLFEGCPGRADVMSTSTSSSIAFTWVEGPDDGEFVTFSWSRPYQDGASLLVDLAVPRASFDSPPGFTAAVRVNDGTGRLPYVSALPGWSREATVAFPANLDRYQVDIAWSTNSPFGYGCGEVSTVAHRYVLERR